MITFFVFAIKAFVELIKFDIFFQKLGLKDGLWTDIQSKVDELQAKIDDMTD